MLTENLGEIKEYYFGFFLQNLQSFVFSEKTCHHRM